MDSRMKGWVEGWMWGWVDSWIDGQMNREIDEGRLDGMLGVGMDVERWMERELHLICVRLTQYALELRSLHMHNTHPQSR